MRAVASASISSRSMRWAAARTSSRPSDERSDSSRRVRSDWRRAVVHLQGELAFHQGDLHDDLPVLRERTPAEGVRLERGQAHSRRLIPYAMWRHTILRSSPCLLPRPGGLSNGEGGRVAYHLGRFGKPWGLLPLNVALLRVPGGLVCHPPGSRLPGSLLPGGLLPGIFGHTRLGSLQGSWILQVSVRRRITLRLRPFFGILEWR